jgi:hypothetical protein
LTTLAFTGISYLKMHIKYLSSRVPSLAENKENYLWTGQETSRNQLYR